MVLVWFNYYRRRWLAECQVAECRWKSSASGSTNAARAVVEADAKVHAEVHMQPVMLQGADYSVIAETPR